MGPRVLNMHGHPLHDDAIFAVHTLALVPMRRV